jgi:hypothetical protein
MAVVITRREHATILAALRHLARRGGFENTAEVGIATDMDQWKAMSPDEIDDLGDRFNAGSDPMHNVAAVGEGRDEAPPRSSPAFASWMGSDGSLNISSKREVLFIGTSNAGTRLLRIRHNGSRRYARWHSQLPISVTIRSLLRMTPGTPCAYAA